MVANRDAKRHRNSKFEGRAHSWFAADIDQLRRHFVDGGVRAGDDVEDIVDLLCAVQRIDLRQRCGGERRKEQLRR